MYIFSMMEKKVLEKKWSTWWSTWNEREQIMTDRLKQEVLEKYRTWLTSSPDAFQLLKKDQADKSQEIKGLFLALEDLHQRLLEAMEIQRWLLNAERVLLGEELE